ncbi:MAG TPA: glycoside hydrolase family 88 protein [Sphaerochaeta sp.]|nr:glycoside hydrolase family 88 protein [Sphaerochaeta sp.]
MNSAENFSLAMARSVKARYTQGMMRWHYEHGLVIQACLAVGQHYQQQEFSTWAYGMYDPLIALDGQIATYRQGEYNLDQINAGRNLFTLHESTGEERFLLAAHRLKEQLLHHPRTFSGVFWHKEIYPWQIWLDGLYMQGPFNAQYSKRFGKSEDLEDLIAQVQTVYQLLRDPVTGLLYHAYDESRGMRWSDEKTGLSPHFWGRAVGWFCMALVDIYELLPQDHPKGEVLSSILVAVLEAVVSFQDSSGLWYQVMDRAAVQGNYLESSCSSMFATVLFKAVRLGIVKECREKERYLTQARKALEGLNKTFLRQDEGGALHLGGVCTVAGLGGNPYRDGSYAYYISEAVAEDDFKGVGPYILALLESEQAQ